MNKPPQRLCAQCRRVAQAGSRLCDYHAKQRTNLRHKRAVATRLVAYLPENRSLENVVELPSLDCRAVDSFAIARCANSITRALRQGRIDRSRAAMFFYGLTTNQSLRRQFHPEDPGH